LEVLPRVEASTPATTTIPVDPVLARAFAAAGIERPDDGGRLSAGQLARLLDGMDTSTRIQMKTLLVRAGLYPQV
jgi:hypothetical protein